MSTPEDMELDIWEHIDELVRRARIIILAWFTTMAFVAFAPASLLRYPPSFDFDINANYNTIVGAFIEYVKENTAPQGITLIAGTWTGSIELYFNASALLGFIIALPIIAYEIYAFVKPALYPEEKSAAAKFALSFIALFIMGALISFYAVIPVTLRILTYFIGMIGAEPIFFVDDFYNFIFLSTVIIGLVFTFPNWVYILVKIGLIDHRDLSSNRRNFILGVSIVTAVLTPDPTPFSMLIISIPLIALYEISIYVAKKAEYEV